MTLTGPITIVIPVYDGLDDVVRCITSILAHTPAEVGGVATEILVIDDRSPDPAMGAALDELARRPGPVPVRLDRHEVNRGFVASVNSAFAAGGGDVVLVNADTVVTAGWLDRMVGCASASGVATVTPLTNHGSICTLPRAVIERFALAGPDPEIDACGRFVTGHSIGLAPEVITGVGFCMYVTREALDLAGPFDEAAYGRGYGEEVDFCVRATRLGLRHLVDESTFVWHRGGASFGEERDARMREASTFLRKRYRFFRDANQAERADDPLMLPFTALVQGLHDRDRRRPNVLHVLHGPLGVPGGTEKHVEDLIAELADELDVTLLYPVESGFVVETVVRAPSGTHRERHLLPGAARWITGVHDSVAAEALATCLDLFTPDAVHIHSFNGHSLAPLAVLATFAGPVVSFVHDPYLACPHYSLLYRNRTACGIPTDLDVCGRCLPETEQMDVDQLAAFRSFVDAHVESVDHWVFASQSAADHFTRVYELDPGAVELIEHSPTIPDDRRTLDPHVIEHEPLRVAFVGRGWTKKGLRTVNLLADAVADSSIEVHHLGPLVEAASANLRTHGAYDNEVLPELLHLAGISIVLLPGPTPETYGLVMSEAIIAGIPVIGATYGALGERIRRDGVGWTFDPDDAEELIELVRRLDANRHEVQRAAARTATVTFPTPADTAHRYADLYRGAAHHQDEHEDPR